MSTIIGVDVGGTFTDFFILDTTNGTQSVFKVPSTPGNPAEAICNGLEQILARGQIDKRAIARISHGTTVGTNALIQRKGASVALIVTKGFRDLLEIGRQTRPHLYSLQIDAPEPLVPRERRFEADERVVADGTIATKLNSAEIQKIVESVETTDSQSVAICFLFSFLNPSHEQELKNALIAAGHRLVSASSDVQPEFREFERMSTTVLNAYLQPIMVDYLQSLESAVAQIAPSASLRINQSSGGLMSASRAAMYPVRTALSGPAAGAVGAAYVARSAMRSNVITLDMGGTSADVCLIRDHSFSVSYEGSVGGFPIRLPMVDINAVGAGGGSIAWIDRDGLMKVGPMSAGARPGPACYGFGGDAPTVTDANLLLGRLSPRGLLSGELTLDMDRAETAFAALASDIGTTTKRAALGCIEIVVANMARAIRTVSVERGYNPEGFSLLAFGGGGPLHARAVAASLGIREIIVPPHPGILCAQGLLAADVSESFVATRRMIVSKETYSSVMAALGDLLARAQEWYQQESAPPEARHIDIVFDMRYVGQNYELSVPFRLEDLHSKTPECASASLRNAFRDAHEQQYATNNDDAAIEIVNVRVVARVTFKSLRDPSKQEAWRGALPKPREHRLVHFSHSEAIRCPIFDRSEFVSGMVLTGPAILEQLDTTTLLYPGDRLSVDGASNLLIEVAA